MAGRGGVTQLTLGQPPTEQEPEDRHAPGGEEHRAQRMDIGVLVCTARGGRHPRDLCAGEARAGGDQVTERTGQRTAQRRDQRVLKIVPNTAAPSEPPIPRNSVTPDVAAPSTRKSTAF